MIIVLLRFAENSAQAQVYLAAHRDWIRKGLEEGVFLLVGSLAAEEGGCVLAHGVSMEALEKRVEEDPFVAHKVVRAELIEIDPAMTDERLSFLVV